jgi:hypothetical protein
MTHANISERPEAGNTGSGEFGGIVDVVLAATALSPIVEQGFEAPLPLRIVEVGIAAVAGLALCLRIRRSE